jgi:hypothetical protein
MRAFKQPKVKKGIPNKEKVDYFIGVFNSAIDKNIFTLNTGLSAIPFLSQDDFNLAKEQARNNGYELSQFDDNYNTTSYKLTYIGK